MKRFFRIAVLTALILTVSTIPAMSLRHSLFVSGDFTYGVGEKTAVATFCSWFDREVTVKNQSGKMLSDADLVATGCRVFDCDNQLLATVVVEGDINKNGKIESNDAVNLRSALLRKTSYDVESATFAACDINANGKIDSHDFVRLRSYLLGITNNISRTPKAGDEDPTVSHRTVDSDYYIVVPTGCAYAYEYAEKLQTALEQAYSWELPIVTDGSSIHANEIIVGAAGRKGVSDLAKTVGDNEWKVGSVNGRLTLLGDSAKALETCVDSFISTYVQAGKPIAYDASFDYHGEVDLIDFTWENNGDPTVYGGWFSGGYPRLYCLQSGWSVMAHDGWKGTRGIRIFRAVDDCRNWGVPVDATPELKNDYYAANSNFFQAEDGTLYLAYRCTTEWDVAPFYTSIRVSVSYDDGATWQPHSIVIENTETDADRATKGLWEPHMGIMNGKLTCFYANDSTEASWYQNIEYKQWNETKKVWENRTVVCNGNDHESRDGMPVWFRHSSGAYICVVEAYDETNPGCFCIKMTWSEDGVNWSTPVAVMRSPIKGRSCAAPSMAELPGGQIVVSCQSNERYGGENYRFLTCVSNGTDPRYLTEEDFGPHMEVFPSFEEGTTSMWNSLIYMDHTLYAISTTSNQGVVINRFKPGK